MKIITYQQAQEIIDVACNNWKDKLFILWGKYIVYKKDVEIAENFYQEMRKVCTAEQHELFDTIFGKDNIPESGTLVYVRDAVSNWNMRFYSHYQNGTHFCFNDQEKQGSIKKWNFVSLTNPLIEEPKYI